MNVNLSWNISFQLLSVCPVFPSNILLIFSCRKFSSPVILCKNLITFMTSEFIPLPATLLPTKIHNGFSMLYPLSSAWCVSKISNCS